MEQGTKLKSYAYLIEKYSHPLLQDAIEEVADKDSSSTEEESKRSVTTTVGLAALLVVVCAHCHHGGVTVKNDCVMASYFD